MNEAHTYLGPPSILELLPPLSQVPPYYALHQRSIHTAVIIVKSSSRLCRSFLHASRVRARYGFQGSLRYGQCPTGM